MLFVKEDLLRIFHFDRLGEGCVFCVRGLWEGELRVGITICSDPNLKGCIAAERAGLDAETED